ncbi:MAG: RagB/SusD family nutrient uptake outer membrane protein [Chitinophagaceae bacterium]
MKYISRFYYIILFALIAVFSACKKSFFERNPQDELTIASYYQTDDQVYASTNALYSVPWFGWNTKVGWAIGEMMSGNGRSYSSDVANFGGFAVTSANTELTNAWNALFTVVAQSNGLINNLPQYVGSSVTSSVLQNALGEAHFMRGLAYFYLVRLFGPVPIIEDYEDYITDYQINTNLVTDVYKFIKNDMLYAVNNCTSMVRSGSSTAQGHISSGSAEAMLSKVYLTMQNYDSAKYYAQKVINSGEFKLYGSEVTGMTFEDLFKTANNNNEESVVALQWNGNGGYGYGNAVQSSFAYTTTLTGTGDGYGVCGPTFDLQDLYSSGDIRRIATIMLAGDYYSYLLQADGGFTVSSSVNPQGTHAAVKKYVVGTPADNGGVGSAQSTSMNTYLMRYSEVYLILAEAVMAGQSSSTDATALAAINMVRERAGLSDLLSIRRGYYTTNAAYSATTNPNAPQTLYRDDILDERRRELAFENDFWFDLCRLDGFNVSTHPTAITIIKQQDRGTSDNSTVPVRYGNGYYTPTDDDFIFPYPATATSSNPLLLEDPVSYSF